MANPEHVKLLLRSVKAWNEWREDNPQVTPDLVEANLRRADLSGAYLTAADLRGADLSGANLMRANLRKAKLDGAYVRNADLRGAVLEDTYLRNADLCGADLRGAVLSAANLSEANLSGADLRWAFILMANLSMATLRSTRLTAIGEGTIQSSFLDLLSVLGLDTVDFGDPNLLHQYLAEAFHFAHHGDYAEKIFPGAIEATVKKIRLLRELYGDEVEPPAGLVEAVGRITSELIKYLARHPRALYELRPRQFEELIAEILASCGWKVNLTPATKDGGYDIYAISPNKAGVETHWIIECKKYGAEHKVGVDIVRALFGVKTNMTVAGGMLATTSYFTKGAREFKASRYDLALKDYEGVLEWINEYRPNPNGRLYLKDDRLIIAGGKRVGGDD